MTLKRAVMIDLDKEFRTLRLLSSVFIILGAGLTLAGFGLVLLMSDPAMNERKPLRNAPEESSPVARARPKSQQELKEKFSNSTGQIGKPTGVLGLLFLLLGGVLRIILRNNFDDGEETQSNPELFRAYAAQLVVAEQKRAKKKESEQ